MYVFYVCIHYSISGFESTKTLSESFAKVSRLLFSTTKLNDRSKIEQN